MEEEKKVEEEKTVEAIQVTEQTQPIEQTETTQEKKSILNNRKEVKGKPLKIWLVVMIAIFMLFTFGLGVYFGKEIFIEKERKSNNGSINDGMENNNNNTVENNNETATHDDSEKIKEANQLLRDLMAFDSNVEDRITYYANNKIVDASSLDHEIVYQIVFSKYYYNKNLEEISLDDFNSKVKEMIDDSYSYVAKDYYNKCSGRGYKLEENKYVYVPYNGGCGGTGYGFDIDPYKVISVDQNENSLVVKVKVLFGKYLGKSKDNKGLADYYSDYDQTKVVEGANQDNYEDYINEGSTYNFTFINRNGNYLFSKAELSE